MRAAADASMPFMPPRRPLCRRCDDTGEVRLAGTLGFDACPDCVRNAEMRWLGAGAVAPLMRRPGVDAQTSFQPATQEASHG